MSRRNLVLVSLAASAMTGITPSLGRAQYVACISSEARATVTACPSLGSGTSGARGSAAASHFAPVRARETTPSGPSHPGIELDPHDEALGAHVVARTRELLEHEISTIERIVDRGGATGTREAEYLARLAETYFELQTYWRARAQEQLPDAEAHTAEAQGGAIRTYARLIQDHPDYPQLDQVLFSLAYGLEESERPDEARQVYLRLVRDFPASRFVPHAWLAFAEYAFEHDDLGAAAQLYARVLETPPEAPNPVYGYALYKQAWVLYNQEDFQGALTQFVRVIEFASSHPDAHDAASLVQQARRELVLPYARVGRPSQALAFFRRYASDDAQAIDMLESLAELYEDTGQWPEAVTTFHALMAEQPASDRLCRWQSRVTSAVISSRPKPEQVTEVHRLVDVMDAFAAVSHPLEAQTECRQASATILVELATAWHREALGDGTQPGTNDRNTMQLAGELYQLVIAELPDMEQLEYPEIDRRDWPTLYRVSYFYAELLWRMDDWAECGPAFDRVVDLDPAGELTADAAYATVLCYDHLYQAEYAPRERERTLVATTRAPPRRRHGHAPASETAPAGPDAPRELTGTERGMVRAFQRYLCTVPDGDERATVQYRLGRVYYEARHFEEASVAFRAVATEHASSDLGEIAANLHLDSLEAIRRRDTRESCLADVRADIDPLSQRYCASADATDAHPDLCPVLENLACDVLRLDAEHLAHAGDHAGAARGYVSLARDHVACGRRDEMLWNAAIEYEAARLLGRAIQVRQALVEGFPESALAHRAIYLVGASYHALAIYSSAADWYERFAREHPAEDGSACSDDDRAAGTCAVAHVALENAVFFRLGLGDTDRAIADAALYARSYRRTLPRQTSEVVFSLGEIYEHQADWARVAQHYRTFLHDYGSVAYPHEVLHADVMLGRAELAEDRPDRAEPHFRAALAAWNRAGPDAITRLEGTDDQRALWLARARDAVSEARYLLAEQRFDAFRAIRFPRFSAQRTLAAVMRWTSTELGPWLAHRFEALHDAEQAYDEIAPLGIPEWQIAAAERVGEMYRTIVDDVRSAPVPEEIEDDDELYGIYATTLERVLNGSSPGPDERWGTADDVLCTPQSTEPTCVGAPIRQATERFGYCLTLATRVRWFDEHSARCERELHAMDAAAYPIAAELRGTASYDVDAPAPPSPVRLERDGDAEPTAEASPAPPLTTPPSSA